MGPPMTPHASEQLIKQDLEVINNMASKKETETQIGIKKENFDEDDDHGDRPPSPPFAMDVDFKRRAETLEEHPGNPLVCQRSSGPGQGGMPVSTPQQAFGTNTFGDANVHNNRQPEVNKYGRTVEQEIERGRDLVRKARYIEEKVALFKHKVAELDAADQEFATFHTGGTSPHEIAQTFKEVAAMLHGMGALYSSVAQVPGLPSEEEAAVDPGRNEGREQN